MRSATAACTCNLYLQHAIAREMSLRLAEMTIYREEITMYREEMNLRQPETIMNRPGMTLRHEEITMYCTEMIPHGFAGTTITLTVINCKYDKKPN
jgi:hypothetical protein